MDASLTTLVTDRAQRPATSRLLASIRAVVCDLALSTVATQDRSFATPSESQYVCVAVHAEAEDRLGYSECEP